MDTDVELPEDVGFPAPGTSEFAAAIAQAADGILRIGVTADGWLDWNLKDDAHAHFGPAEQQRAVPAFKAALFYALALPEHFRVTVCGPAPEGLEWVAELPNVKMAPTLAQSYMAIIDALHGLNIKQNTLLLSKCRDMPRLRAADQRNPNPDLWLPARHVLVFTEIADLYVPRNNPELEWLRRRAVADLLRIARLGRPTEVNIISATTPDGESALPMMLRSGLQFRLGMGRLTDEQSLQLLHTPADEVLLGDHHPPGRGRAYRPRYGYTPTQLLSFANDDESADGVAATPAPGMKRLVRERLAHLGYQPPTGQDGDGDATTQWWRPWRGR